MPRSKVKMVRHKQKAPRERKRVARRDGWSNMKTGLGTLDRDKRLSANYSGRDPISDETASELWRSEDMAKKIIEKPADEMTRQGFEINIPAPKKKPAGAGDEDTDQLGEEGLEEDETDDLEVPDDEPAEDEEERSDFFPGGPPALPEKPKVPKVIKPKDEETEDTKRAVMARVEELGVLAKVNQAIKFMRAHGGAAILLGLDDGQKPEAELIPEKIKTVRAYTVLKKRELYPVEWYTDHQEPKYGEVKIWALMPLGVGWTTDPKEMKKRLTTAAKIHETRLVIFQGWNMGHDHLLANNGWGESCLAQVLHVLAAFDNVWSNTDALMQDFAQAIFGIKGLAEAIASDNAQAIKDRIEVVEMARSTLRALVLDAENETFTRQQTPLTGLPDLLERWESRLAAAADMPVTILFGRSASGLNATGEQDMQMFYNVIKSLQIQYLKPLLERLIRVIMLAHDGPTKGEEPEDWSIKFCPLWQPTEKEQEETKYTRAQRDGLMIDKGVYTPEEVAVSRFSGADSDITIDLEGRQQLAQEAEVEAQDRAAQLQEMAKNGPQPPAGPPGKKPLPAPGKKPAPFVQPQP